MPHRSASTTCGSKGHAREFVRRNAKHVIGQDEAVHAVADAVMRARSGLKDPHRPIGSFIFLGPTGVGKTELARALAEFLFRPEFHNRVDEVIVFHALDEDHLKEIVTIQLGRVRSRLADRHIALDLTDAAKTHLVRVGYDPAYGARPLKRAIQREVENPLARLILEGKVKDGQSVVGDYDVHKGTMVFTAK